MKQQNLNTFTLSLILLSFLTAGAVESALPTDLPVGGLVVAIGIEDVPLLAELGAKGQRPVHVLSQPNQVQKIRDELRRVGQLGPIQVEGWSSEILPYADHLARIVVSGNDTTKSEELRRITAPFGVRLLRSGSTWKVERETLPEGMDEWTHSWHDAGRSRLSADKITGPAQALQWQAGPLYRQAVTVAGSGCVIALEFPFKDITELVVRDAASGVVRWRNRVTLAGIRGASQGFPNTWFNGDGTGGLNECMTIAGDRLYVAAMPRPLIFHLKDGTNLGELPTSSPVRRLVVQANMVLAASKTQLESFDAATFAPTWLRKCLANDLSLTPSGLAIFIDSSKTPSDLVAVKVADGSDVWRIAMEPYWDASAPVKKSKNGSVEPQVRIAFVTDNLVVLRGSRDGGELIVLDPVSGKERWHGGHVPFPVKQARGPDKPIEGSIPSINQIALGGGHLWYSTGEQPPARIALDPLTGNRVGFLRYTGVNDYCQWSLGSPRLVSFKDCVWLDAVAITGALQAQGASTWKPDGTLTPDGYSTGNGRCGWQPIIAYGQNYFGPKDCNCSTNGAALRAAVERSQILPAQQDDGRLGTVETGSGKPGQELAGWCQFGADARRSFTVKGNLPSTLQERWKISLPLSATSEWIHWVCDDERLSQPVVAGDMVWVSDLDAGEVICLSLGDGKEIFRSSVGSRIDGPPAISQGFAVIGGHDGWLYTWSTADGKLVRRTRLAAGERRIAIQGRIESSWPVAGPVVVDGQRAYAMVGRYQRMAERVHTTAVNLSDGIPVWRKVERAFAGILAIDAGGLISCMGIGSTGWWGEQLHGVNRDPANGAPAKATPPITSVLARSHLLQRSQPGPVGVGPFICADDGTNVAWFDYTGREVRMSTRTGFAPKMKFSGSIECLNGPDLTKNSTWRLTMPDGELAVAVAIAGDAVVCASNRIAPTDKSGTTGAPTAGHIWILNLADGKERHRLELPQAVVHQGLAIHDRTVIVSGRDGLVTAYGGR